MRFRFTKMHGLGNDFVVIDAISQRVRMNPDTAKRLADRQFGVGCDQILLVEAPTLPDCDFRYTIYNSDGSKVENCGNGARCFAKFVIDRKLTGKNTIRVETDGGIIVLHIDNQGAITVDMGQPHFEPNTIGLLVPQQAPSYQLDTRAGNVSFGAVSMGNPHAVITVPSTSSAPVSTIGPDIGSNPLFANGVNVGFMEIISDSEINLRVFERGAGETLACGTGACAAVAVGQLQQRLAQTVKVNLTGGSLSISWQGGTSSVLMTGPATTVFQGQIKI